MAMARLFWLSNEAWALIEPHLPRGQPGKPRVDDRRVISGILHVLKVGCRWRDVPAEYGPATTIYNRYNRWSRRGLWQRLFEKVAATGAVPAKLNIDSTHVKAHRSASGGKGGSGPAQTPDRGQSLRRGQPAHLAEDAAHQGRDPLDRHPHRPIPARSSRLSPAQPDRAPFRSSQKLATDRNPLRPPRPQLPGRPGPRRRHS